MVTKSTISLLNLILAPAVPSRRISLVNLIGECYLIDSLPIQQLLSMSNGFLRSFTGGINESR